MSSKKITAADKLEIVDLYRQAGDTTASLANRYGVSNSTISRLLKTNIPEAEYEILIQQKRGVKVGPEDENLTTPAEPMIVASTDTSPAREIDGGINTATPDLENVSAAAVLATVQLSTSLAEDEDSNATRRLRRRSSAPVTVASDEPVAGENLSLSTLAIDEPISNTTPTSRNIDPLTTPPATKTPPTPRTPVLREILADSENRYFTPVVEPSSFTDIPVDEIDEEEEDDTEDVNILAAMFGEEVADDEDDEDDEDEDEATTPNQLLNPNQLLTEDRLHVQITPLSQATLPRTCYIVIDKFAELIVRPLKDFADLGQISGEETQQRTLPIFDNHRVAKRFSNQRTQRVIKVPDSRVFYKTTQHLKLKGITRLLVDGNIYSLN
jgi:hypothetical protein